MRERISVCVVVCALRQNKTIKRSLITDIIIVHPQKKVVVDFDLYCVQPNSMTIYADDETTFIFDKVLAFFDNL